MRIKRKNQRPDLDHESVDRLFDRFPAMADEWQSVAIYDHDSATLDDIERFIVGWLTDHGYIVPADSPLTLVDRFDA